MIKSLVDQLSRWTIVLFLFIYFDFPFLLLLFSFFILFFLIFVFLKLGFTMQSRLDLYLPCRPSWPWTCSNTIFSAFQMLELQGCATTIIPVSSWNCGLWFHTNKVVKNSFRINNFWIQKKITIKCVWLWIFHPKLRDFWHHSLYLAP